MPVQDGDFIQLNDAVIDAILDEAQSGAVFKCGGQEAQNGFALHENIIKLASRQNSKVRAMSVFRDTLYGRSARENIFSPIEIETQ